MVCERFGDGGNDLTAQIKEERVREGTRHKMVQVKALSSASVATIAGALDGEVAKLREPLGQLTGRLDHLRELSEAHFQVSCPPPLPSEPLPSATSSC
jgi:hypothetical protein